MATRSKELQKIAMTPAEMRSLFVRGEWRFKMNPAGVLGGKAYQRKTTIYHYRDHGGVTTEENPFKSFLARSRRKRF